MLRPQTFYSSYPAKIQNFYVQDWYQDVPGLDDDEHVVDSEAQEQEWDEVVQGTEAEAEGAAEAVRGHHGQHHREQAHDGKVDLLENEWRSYSIGTNFS